MRTPKVSLEGKKARHPLNPYSPQDGGSSYSMASASTTADGTPAIPLASLEFSEDELMVDPKSRACTRILKANLPQTGERDADEFLSRVGGGMDAGLVDRELAFDIEPGMHTTDRLLARRDSGTRYAMVLAAVRGGDTIGRSPVSPTFTNFLGN